MTEWYEKPPMSASKEFIILVGLWVIGLVLGTVLCMPIWMVMTGESPLKMTEELMNPKYRSALLVIQSVSSIFTFLFPALVTALIVSKHPKRHLGFTSSFNIKAVVFVFLVMGSAIILGGLLGELNKAIPISQSLKAHFDALEKQYEDAIRSILIFRNTGDYLISLLVIAVIPAVVEEVLFRGSMQQILIRWFKYPLLGILITSFIFSAIHFSWYGFLPRMALGIVLGYIFYATRNVWYSILAHFFNNGLTVTIVYLQYLKEKKIDLNSEESIPWWAGLISLFVLIVLIKGLFRVSGISDPSTNSFENLKH